MASFSVPCPKSTSISRHESTPRYLHQQRKQSMISFHHGSNSRSTLISGSSLDDPTSFWFQWTNRKQTAVWKVAAEKSSNSAPVLEAKLGVASSEEKEDSPEKLPGHNAIPDVASISAFMGQVSDLVKLVDSRDIMELKLKQVDCEIIIRKKEAMLQPSPAASVVTMQPPLAHSMLPSQPSPAQVIPPPSASPAPSAPAPALPAPAKTSTSSHPPLKCPMAGTFYRCAAPGEPPFVKVGDKVQKGQVICIIEAMKLMNEIEADQSGTIVEILVEEGKPVSVDLPLFVIAP